MLGCFLQVEEHSAAEDAEKRGTAQAFKYCEYNHIFREEIPSDEEDRRQNDTDK